MTVKPFNIPKQLVWEAYLRVRTGGKSPGEDGKTLADFEEDLQGNLYRLWNRLSSGSYFPPPVKRVEIPKDSGGTRALGIPVLGDKLVQHTAAQILSAIFEQDFLPFSHGYRRGKGPQRAALELSKRIHRGRFRWVYDADIKGFFDHLDHDWLIRMLEQRIDDRAFLGLIRKWLKAGILEEDGQVIFPATGTPQGGVVSAVLANIYLHFALDLWFEKVVEPRAKGDVLIMRFADDFVCCFQYQEDLQKLQNDIEERLGKFNLEISKEKTKVIKFTRFETKKSDTFVFLGFEYRWILSRKKKPLVSMKTARKKFLLALSAMQTWVKSKRCVEGTEELMEQWRAKLQGHYNYYGVSGNFAMLSSFYHLSCRIVFKWLNRRSQRRSYNWRGFTELMKSFAIPRPRIIGYW